MKTIVLSATFLAALAMVAIGLSSSVSRAANEAAPSAQSAHDLSVNYVSLSGPGAVNLSDTNGRYMWVVSEITNHSDHTEMIHLGMTVAPAVPVGCVREESMVVPTQDSFLMYAEETKTIVWRVRYECHSPARFSVLKQTATVGITHCDPTTSLPGPVTQPTPGGACPPNGQPAGHEADVSNNTKSATRQFMVR